MEENVEYIKMSIIFSYKNKWNSDMCCEHGQSLKHAKKNKADTKKQALYDFFS